MEITVNFTIKEMELLTKGLTFGLIHSEDDREREQMEKLERKMYALTISCFSTRSEKIIINKKSK